jgi:hypothetical protein
MGDSARGLEVEDQRNEVVACPTWGQILRYEFQIRKEQAKLIIKGKDFKAALTDACADDTVRERHFITKEAVSAVPTRTPSRSPRRGSSSAPPRRSGQKGSKGGKSGTGMAKRKSLREPSGPRLQGRQEQRCRGARGPAQGES